MIKKKKDSLTKVCLFYVEQMYKFKLVFLYNEIELLIEGFI